MRDGLRIDRVRHEVERLPLAPGDPDVAKYAEGAPADVERGAFPLEA